MSSRLLLLLLLFTLGVSQAAQTLPTEPHILVSGNFRIKVVPDTLHMSLSMIETGMDVAVVSRQVESRSAKLIKALKVLGIKTKDIASSQLRITPHYNWRKQQQVYAGTEVSRNLEITLRELKLYDKLIRVLLDLRVGRINNSRLEYSKAQDIRKKALQGAIKDARAKAELLLSDVPEKLGTLFSITHQAGQPIVRQTRLAYQAREVASADSAFEPGVIEFSETVTVIYYLSR